MREPWSDSIRDASKLLVNSYTRLHPQTVLAGCNFGIEKCKTPEIPGVFDVRLLYEAAALTTELPRLISPSQGSSVRCFPPSDRPFHPLSWDGCDAPAENTLTPVFTSRHPVRAPFHRAPCVGQALQPSPGSLDCCRAKSSPPGGGVPSPGRSKRACRRQGNPVPWR